MSTSRMVASIGALACTLLLVSACAGQRNGQVVNVVEEEGGLLQDAAVKPDAAMQTARAAVPGAVIQSAAIEREGGALIYTFDLKVAGKDGVEEVHVDAMTGAVLSNAHEADGAAVEAESSEQEGDEAGEAAENDEEDEATEAAEVEGAWDGKVEEAEAGLLAKAAIGSEAAIKAALAAVPGGAITSAEIENEDGKFIYSFDVRVTGKEGLDEVWIDAMTGAVVQIKHEG